MQAEIIHFAQIENNMALNEQDRAWIREQINSAFERRNVWQRIRDWLPVTAMIAIAIYALTQWTNYVEFRTKTNDRLDTMEKGVGTIENRLGTIEQTLAGIQSNLSKQSLINHAALPLPDFKATLPDLSSAIAAATRDKVKVAPRVVEDLQTKLTASANAPSFWPAAADFISYRSQIVSHDVQSLMAAALPNCTDRAPTPLELVVSDEEAKYGKAGDVANLPDLLNETDKNKTHIVPAVYKDCRFTLDSPEEAARIPNLGEQRSYVLTFRHCQIVYRGGAVTLLTPHPKPTTITGKSRERSDVYLFVGQIVHFENCLFVFAIHSTPPANGQALTQQILTQNGNNLTVKLPHV
jgi:hypothetical protein